MLPVEILPVQETIVLRARGSELLILPHHVKKLKGLSKSRDFSQYFRDEALVNRPARKLFEAWLRKDHTLWQRLYTTVHKEMDSVAADAGGADETAAKSVEPAPASVAAETGDEGEVAVKPAPKKKTPAAKKEKDEEPKKKAASSTKKDEEPKKKAASSTKKDEEPKTAASSKKDDKKPTAAKAAAGTKAKKKG